MNVFDVLKNLSESQSPLNDLDGEVPHSVLPVGRHSIWISEICESLAHGDYIHKSLGHGTAAKKFLIVNCDRGPVLLKTYGKKSNCGQGLKEIDLSPAYREMAFYEASKAFGVYVPRAELIEIDGAIGLAVEYLDEPWGTLDLCWRTQKASVMRGFLAPHLKSGQLHKWAAMDYILGNTDRHGNNILGNPATNEVALIDHGGSLAGYGFNPSKDKSSYIPFYLRAWYKKVGFNDLSDVEKLQVMPVSQSANKVLSDWEIDFESISMVLSSYGIDLGPFQKRYEQVFSVKKQKNICLMINALWI